jgi:hypothetical protein
MFNSAQTSREAVQSNSAENSIGYFHNSDVVTTVIQILGTALIRNTENKNKDPILRNNILLGGLAIQVFNFFIFVIIDQIRASGTYVTISGKSEY